jgi:hypothetical protein
MTKTKDGGMTNDETANSDESTDQAVYRRRAKSK